MNGCGLAFDPAGVRSAIDACLAIIEQPDSAANFARGVLVASVFALALIGGFVAMRRAVR